MPRLQTDPPPSGREPVAGDKVRRPGIGRWDPKAKARSPGPWVGDRGTKGRGPGFRIPGLGARKPGTGTRIPCPTCAAAQDVLRTRRPANQLLA